jgi:transposase
MKPYSLDLRERVIAMVQEDDLSQPQVAKHFHVSLGTVENWWRLWRETGSLAPQLHAGGAKRTLAACDGVIRAAVEDQPDATLEEFCAHVQATAGVRAHPSMMCRELQILDLPRKKVIARQST